MSRQVALEFAATAVRAGQAGSVRSDGFIPLSRVAVRPVPNGVIAAGAVLRPTVAGNAAAEALEGIKASTSGVVVGLSGPSVGLGLRDIPTAVKDKERLVFLRSTDPVGSLPWNEARVALFPLPGGTRTDAKGREVRPHLVATAAEEDLDGLFAALAVAKVVPSAVDLSAVATVRALMRVPVADDSIATLIDIGATQTTVVTRQGMTVRSLRTINRGGHDITRAVMGALQTDFEDAERRKHYVTLPARPGETGDTVASQYTSRMTASTGTSTTIEQAVEASATALLDQILRSMDADAVAHSGRTAGVVVTGGGSLLRGLPERLSVRLGGLPVRQGRPWVDVDPDDRGLAALVETAADGTRRPDKRALLRMATVIGLTQWSRT